jgi:hypothetical protein
MALLYANGNFPRQAVESLRAFGHDVLTTQAGNAGQAIPDEEVVEYATRAQRAVVTLNRRDFIRLHTENQAHAGIIVCSQDPDPVGQARRIHEMISVTPSLNGKLLRVNRPSGG